MSTPNNYRPIFIGGSQRNGTTLLGSLLGTSSETVVTPESQFVVDLWKASYRSGNKVVKTESVMTRLKKHFRFHLWESDAPHLANYESEILDAAGYVRFVNETIQFYADKTEQSDAKIWVDHTPTHIQYGMLLNELFPSCKFIHLIRDPRAVAASIIERDWGPDTAKEAAKLWAESIGYGCDLKTVLKDRVLVVYYEDLLKEPKKTLMKVCEFAGIAYSDDMLSGKGLVLPEYTKDQHSLVGQGIDPKRIDSWKSKLTAMQIYEIEERLFGLMEIHGYEQFQVDKPPKLRFINKFGLFVEQVKLELNRKSLRRRKKKFKKDLLKKFKAKDIK